MDGSGDPLDDGRQGLAVDCDHGHNRDANESGPPNGYVARWSRAHTVAGFGHAGRSSRTHAVLRVQPMRSTMERPPGLADNVQVALLDDLDAADGAERAASHSRNQPNRPATRHDGGAAGRGDDRSDDGGTPCPPAHHRADHHTRSCRPGRAAPLPLGA